MSKRLCKWMVALVLILVFASGALAEEVNLVPNGGFEDLDSQGRPISWYSVTYRNQAGYSRMSVTDEKAYAGKYSALIYNANENDARFVCDVAVEPENLYRFSGYVLVEHMGNEGNGANLALEDYFAFSGPLRDTGEEWQYVECYGETGPGQTMASIGVRIGGYGAESAGKAYFDEISVVKVDTLPDEIVASLWYKDDEPLPGRRLADESKQKSTTWFLLISAIFVIFALAVQAVSRKPKDLRRQDGPAGEIMPRLAFCILMLAGLAVRIVLACRIEGYEVDIGCFSSWSLRMAETGPSGFYAEGYFCDYPPGLLLFLWPVGGLMRLLSTAAPELRLLAIKLIPIISDMAIAMCLFFFARKRVSTRAAAAAALLYTLNPAALVNGAAWGQVDSLLALFMLLAAVYALEKKWVAVLPLYTAAVLIKPQALLFAPVGLIWLVAALIRERRTGKQVRPLLFGLFLSILVAAVIVLPFSINMTNPAEWLWNLYKKTLSSYQHATVNAANLYYLFGGNWKELDLAVPLGLSLSVGLPLLGFGSWQISRKAPLLKAERSRRGKPGRQLKLRRRLDVKNEVAGDHTVLRQLLLAALCVFAGAAAAILGLVGVTYGAFGMILMIFVFLWGGLCCWFEKTAEHLPFLLALALVGVYVLGTQIHERYLFAALPMLLMAYAATRDKRILILFVGFSVSTFINTAIILDNSILFGREMGHLNADTQGLNLALCAANLLLCVYAGFISFMGVRSAESLRIAKEQPSSPPRDASYRQGLLAPSCGRLRLGLRDWMTIGVASIIYAGLAFINLGSPVAPQNGWVSTSAEEQIVFAVGADEPFSLVYYAGISYNPFSIAVSADGEQWSEDFPCDMRQDLCFRWQYATKSEERDGKVVFLDHNPDNVLWLTGKYFKLNAENIGLNLFEIIARSASGRVIPLTVERHTGFRADIFEQMKPAENLIDEQDTLRGEPGWYNGTYFDEIYHARTAYEHLHGEAPHETTHPPLGKLIMAASVAIFGMTPFGWRFAGALMGVLMLPALYMLAKQLTGRRDLATFSMLLLALDLMHFTQTRIATIDSFAVLFILLAYLCMARYLMTDVFALWPGEPVKLLTSAFWRSLLPLAFSGVFMGLAIASKWIGFYSAVGLAALFAAAVYRQFRMSNIAFAYSSPMGNAELDEERARRVENARRHSFARILITCGFCVIFFLLIPAVIYCLSYIPYLRPTGAVTLRRIIGAQEVMLNYHATPGLGMDHPYQSPWWQWPFIGKPMWFARDAFEPAGYQSTIFCMGNPAVFYVGAPAMAAVFVLFARKYISFRQGIRLRGADGNMTLPVIVAGFLAQYMPWVLVPRSMFIYHYFASVPFIILATAWISTLLDSRPKLRARMQWGLVVLAAVFFVLFYPYASGVLTPKPWLDAMKWFPGIKY